MTAVIRALKNGKAAGLDEIASKTVKYGGRDMARTSRILCWTVLLTPADDLHIEVRLITVAEMTAVIWALKNGKAVGPDEAICTRLSTHGFVKNKPDSMPDGPAASKYSSYEPSSN
ncbi:hypothetical protein ROHU_023841 [Labeo rohita]|uniref:Uncharacterized protein n=1 Tax=Labeo rohita TaxID=84645 RepID=A0A498MZL3_LABRO|nr:hypothetical protein ROHU_023841 [Labeo rohita]